MAFRADLLGRRFAVRTMYSVYPAYRAVLSPCTGVCTLGEDGYCLGCHRSGAEIARWLQMGDDERLRLMETELPLREAARG